MSIREYEQVLSAGPRILGVPAIPLIALIVANLLPLAGVFWLDWDLRSVLLLYWAENVVVALWAAARMLVVGGPGAVPTILFFCVHFGIFTFVHLIFVYVMTEAVDWNRVEWEGSGFQAPNKAGASGFPTSAFFAQLSPWALAALLVSHGVSFVRNFLKGGEWKHSSVGAEMARPYPRMIVMHIAIIAGGFFIAATGQPVALLAVLVLLKIVLDAAAHVVEHRLARGRRTRLEVMHSLEHQSRPDPP